MGIMRKIFGESTNKSRSILLDATFKNDYEKVHDILVTASDPDYKSEALYVALRNGYSKIVTDLQQHGTKITIDQKNKYDNKYQDLQTLKPKNTESKSGSEIIKDYSVITAPKSTSINQKWERTSEIIRDKNTNDIEYDIFLSHVEEDQIVALGIAKYLNSKNYTVWSYENNSIPGISYLIQTGDAISKCRVFLILISAHSLSSRQIDVEVERAYEESKPFLPIRIGISHVEFQNRRPLWRQALGTTASIEIKEKDMDECFPRIVKGLEILGIYSNGRR